MIENELPFKANAHQWRALITSLLVSLREFVLEFLRLILNLYRFTKGCLIFFSTGLTPSDAPRALSYLSNLTNGRLNDALVFLARLRHASPTVRNASGVLGDLTDRDLQRIVAGISERGYYVFESKLPQQVCDGLMQFALSKACVPMGMDSTDTLNQFNYKPGEPCLYDRNNVISMRYDFDAQVVSENRLVQSLIIDPTLLAIAGMYLGTESVNDITTMWWSTALKQGKGSSTAAQFYHCDTDRIRFIKFFFYLTEVDSSTGPHCLVARSHRRKPRPLLRGSRRISDEEIECYYPKDDILELVGPRGTILAVDNSGFHKGKPLERGERLILQILFETSRFGTPYGRVKINDRFSEEFLALAHQRPRIFENFEFEKSTLR